MSHPGPAHGYPCFPCLLIAAPFYLAMQRQRHLLHLQSVGHTMNEDTLLPEITGLAWVLKHSLSMIGKQQR
jgi:hypothetical protein